MRQRINITGIILAGGQSSRMGSDKGLLSLHNLFFVEHIIKALQPVVNNILIVSNSSNYDEFGYERIPDTILDAGPLAGLYSGLQHSTTDYNLVLSCDIPLIKTEVLEILIDNIEKKYQVIQLQSKNKTMPLIALYKKECMHTCLELLQRDERRLQKAINQLQTKTIILDSEFESYTNNINTKDQLISLRNDTKR